MMLERADASIAMSGFGDSRFPIRSCHEKILQGADAELSTGFFRLYPNLSKAITYWKCAVIEPPGDSECTDSQGNLYSHILKSSLCHGGVTHSRSRPPAMGIGCSYG